LFQSLFHSLSITFLVILCISAVERLTSMLLVPDLPELASLSARSLPVMLAWVGRDPH
jgi:hypothetical protein